MAIHFTLREQIREHKITPNQRHRTTEREFAEVYKFRQNTIYDICNNKIKQLPVELIDRISNALKLPPSAWMKWEYGEPVQMDEVLNESTDPK